MGWSRQRTKNLAPNKHTLHLVLLLAVWPCCVALGKALSLFKPVFVATNQKQLWHLTHNLVLKIKLVNRYRAFRTVPATEWPSIITGCHFFLFLCGCHHSIQVNYRKTSKLWLHRHPSIYLLALGNRNLISLYPSQLAAPCWVRNLLLTTSDVPGYLVFDDPACRSSRSIYSYTRVLVHII